LSEYTREEILKLIEENGGPEGLDLSGKDLWGMDLSREAMAAELEKTQEKALGETPVWYSRWRKGVNLRAVILRGADLRVADFSGAYLIDADLTYADLREAYLVGAYLGGAELRHADLSGSDLSRADLTLAVLDGANLRGVNLRGANLARALLMNADLTYADLSEADLLMAELIVADLIMANLSEANLREAHLSSADLSRADLSKANLIRANLCEANLYGANLCKADLYGANLSGVDLSEADLSEADLRQAQLVCTDLTGANLTSCSIFGISAWGLELNGAIQSNLIITPPDEPTITVDNLEVAQFIYLLLNNEKIRDVIDTITTKVVLILGRFAPERKAVLDAIRRELRKHNYSPVLFDFDKPVSRDLTETITLLARMSRFIIADITDPRSIPQELYAIVPHLRSVPVQPLLEHPANEYGMFQDLRKYDWVLETYQYDGLEGLLASLGEIIAPAETKAKELEKR
jgi:uncharacterized protein YjbI with pentapeptide repeats